MVLASPLGRQMLARFIKWKEGICDASPEYHRLAGSWDGSRRGLLDQVLVSDWSNVPADVVKSVFRSAVTSADDWQRTIAEASERDLIELLAEESGNFGFNLENEAVWGLTAAAAEELKPVSDALITAAGARRWWEGTILADQRFVAWDGCPPLRGSDLETEVRAAMRELRPGCPDNLQPGFGSEWWSIPSFAERSWTANELDSIWSTGLLYFSDAFGPRDDPAVLIANGEIPALWQMTFNASARVYEVGCPEDWGSLVDRFPCAVSRTHGYDWSRWGNAPGPWLLPDWENVMECYDGVHVSIGGYLLSCGLAIPVRNGYSMLVGWLPGATLWLRDAAMEVAELRSATR
jgi:hypothetical protein